MMKSRKTGAWGRRRRASALLAASLVAAGCSVNEFGLVAVERTAIEGGVIVLLTAPGLHLDTIGRDPSLTFGRYEALHLFSDVCAAAEGRRADLVIRRIDGLQITAGPGEVGVMIGRREQAQLAMIDRSASMVRFIELNLKDYAQSKLEFEGDCAA